MTGISDPPSTDTGNPAVFDRIRDAGARWVRITIEWRDVAPASKPIVWDPTNPNDLNYRWGTVDSQVINAYRAGLTPLVQIYTAPQWAEGCFVREYPKSPCDPNPSDVADFSLAVARRFSGGFKGLPRVRYWELFNEPNLDLYFNPQFRNGRPVSPLLYRRLIDVFATAINSVDKSNLVVGPGMAPLSNAGFSLGPLDFMRRMLCMKGRRHPQPKPGCTAKTPFDIWTTNPYTTGGPKHHAAGPDDVSLGDLPEMRRLLRASERAGHIETQLHPIPFWITEFSWDSKPPDPGGLSWGILARWAAEAMYRSWLAGVTNFFWLGIRDQPNPENRPPWLVENSGLYLRGATLADDKPKRVLYAFRFPFVAFSARRGIRVWGRTPDSRPGSVRIEVRIGGHWRVLKRLRANRFGIFGRVIPTAYGRNKHGLVRARLGPQKSSPFSLKYVGDFYAPPFGLAPGQSHVPQRR